MRLRQRATRTTVGAAAQTTMAATRPRRARCAALRSLRAARLVGVGLEVRGSIAFSAGNGASGEGSITSWLGVSDLIVARGPGAGDAGVADGRGRDWAFQHSVMGDCPAMELHEAIRRRAMVRSFSAEPVEQAVLDRILSDALRSPTAGNTRGTAWVVLEGPEQTCGLLRRHHGRGVAAAQQRVGRASGGPRLSCWPTRLPTSMSLATASPTRWDQAWAGMRRRGRSPTGRRRRIRRHGGPAGCRGCRAGACILGTFRGEAVLAERLWASPRDGDSSLPWPLGQPDGNDHPSPSLVRNGPDRSERIHLGSW